MLDEFNQVITQLKTAPDDVKATMQTWFVVKCVMAVVYYAIAGVVVWALGRRLIQASFAAWREARRSP
jgi:hypothetical protein